MARTGPVFHPYTKVRTCVVCRQQFQKTDGGRNKGLCCSRPCGWELGRRRGAESRAKTAERRANARAENQRLKAEERANRQPYYVRNRDAILSAQKQIRLEIRQSRPERPCAACGEAFIPVHGQRRYCSDACARRRRKRIEKRLRRARKRAVQCERIDPMLVFARDRWRCQLCGCSTPKRYQGAMRPDAPELDHIVPLSQGGSHTHANVQCACRSCNGKKGAAIRGQLRLAV